MLLGVVKVMLDLPYSEDLSGPAGRFELRGRLAIQCEIWIAGDCDEEWCAGKRAAVATARATEGKPKANMEHGLGGAVLKKVCFSSIGGPDIPTAVVAVLVTKAFRHFDEPTPVAVRRFALLWQIALEESNLDAERQISLRARGGLLMSKNSRQGNDLKFRWSITGEEREGSNGEETPSTAVHIHGDG